MSLCKLNSVYSDELITATDLNRQSGKILDKALQHPVTITRNDEHFALLRRQDVAFLVEAAEKSFAAVEVLSVAFRLLLGEKIGVEHPYGWMQVFDSDELQDLIEEVTQVYRSATSSNIEWSEVEATIHEWHESALAIASPEIAAAFNDEFDEVALTQPSLCLAG